MANQSKIEWTESSWNTVTGCSKISSGCLHCYAERMTRRLQAMGQPNYSLGFKVAVHKHVLDIPLRWKKPRKVFVNSMSDLFHEEVPVEFIRRVFDVMRRAHWHSFQVLTKRAERLEEIGHELDWSPNVWMGVSVETRKYLHRINHLREVDAAVRFVSFEPLLESLGNIDLSGIDWVIVGGESGPKARPMDPAWARAVRDQCLAVGVPFFFKQWGNSIWPDNEDIPEALLARYDAADCIIPSRYQGYYIVGKKEMGRHLDGREWNEYPGAESEPRTIQA